MEVSMTGGFVSLSANTVRLSPAAFTRLFQSTPADVALPSVVRAPPRLDLLRQATTAMAREAQAVSTPASQQKSWASRHKGAIVLMAFAGALALGLTWYLMTDCNHTGCE
jgi:hypothetical protein